MSKRVDALPVPVRVSGSRRGDGGLARAAVAVLASAAALIVVALADRRGQFGESRADLLFWIGVLGVFLPPAWFLLGSSIRGGARGATVLWLALALYLVKLMQNPVAFTYHDEFSSLRTTQTLARTGHMFVANPLIPIHPYYPGLELATTAVASLSGARVFVAGIIVIGVARIALIALLFALFERLTGSARLASIAAVIYMTNPNFLFFDAQFAYESMALALGGLLLLVGVLPLDKRRAVAVPLAAVASVALAVTHHLTSFATLGFLLLVVVFGHKQKTAARGTRIAAVTLLVAVAAWSGVVGHSTFNYLRPVFDHAWSAAVGLATGSHGPKHLFHSGDANNPIWERLVASGSVALTLAALPFGLPTLRRRWADPFVRALAVSLIAYPVLLGLRLTQAGTEISNRASEFLFVAIAFFIAPVLAAFAAGRSSGARRLGALAFLAVLLSGGIVIGWAPWARVPGPYLVVADPRSVEPRGVAAAEWAHRWIPPGTNIVSDRINRLLMGSYGGVDPLIGSKKGLSPSAVLLSPAYAAAQRALIRRDKIKYVVVDRRLADGLPLVGYYVEVYEPHAFDRRTPLSKRALTKFDGVPGLSRIFDDGAIRIYRVGR
jgi:hypothetical protein